MKKIILVCGLLLLQTIVRAENIFYWKWSLTEGQIKVTGKLNNEREVVIYSESNLIKKRFATLYRIIDEIEYSNANTYKKTVDTLSDLLVNPFSSSISKSRLIVVEIDSTLLNFPIEFLEFKNSAIAIAIPLVFTISGNKNNHYRNSINLHRGFIIRDPSSDPENACKNIFRQYPTSEFKSAYKISEKDLAAKKNIDFILISAHGGVDSITFKGGIALNKTEM